MKKRYLGMILGMVILAVGCASQSAEMAASEEAVESTVTESQADTREETSEEAETSEDGKKAEEDTQKEAESSIQAAEESLKAMEESLKEAESSLAEESEQDGKETDYAKLKEKPGDYLKKQVSFSGRIVRYAPVGSAEAQIVLAVDEKESNRIVGEYKKSIIATNLAVGDKITLSGEFQGMIRYRMQTGGTEDMPTIQIGEITNVIKAEPETVAVTLPASSAADEAGLNVSGENPPEDIESTDTDSQVSQEIEEESESEQRSPVISVGE